MSPRSIRVRLTLWYVALLALVLLVVGSAVYVGLRSALLHNLDEQMERGDAYLAGIVRSDDGRPILPIAINAVDPSPDDQYIRVHSLDGRVTYYSSSLDSVPVVDSGGVAAALAGNASYRTVSSDGTRFRVHFTPLRRDARTIGVLETGQAMDEVERTLRSLLLIEGITFAIAMLIALAGGIFFAQRALAPIDRMTRAARRLSVTDLSQRLDRDYPDDEVGRLARTFDDLLARLEAAFQQQRRFTADASHELRTPLTALLGQLELALAEPRTADVYQKMLRRMRDVVEHLIRLVNGLLALSRADSGAIEVHREPVDLAAVIAATIEQLQVRADERGVTLTSAGPPLIIPADEDLLLQLWLNLVENALAYTPAGGTVAVSWAAHEREVEVHVRDTGIGIAPEHLPHLFERFYRGDAARTRSSGMGLGLAISRWIVQAHQGAITIDSTVDVGTTVRVTLPLRNL